MELPESIEFSTIIAIVNSVSNIISTEGAARLFLHHIQKLHSLFIHIVSNHKS